MLQKNPILFLMERTKSKSIESLWSQFGPTLANIF